MEEKKSLIRIEQPITKKTLENKTLQYSRNFDNISQMSESKTIIDRIACKEIFKETEDKNEGKKTLKNKKGTN